MSVGVTSGYYVSGQTTNSYAGNFIPEIWSGKLQVKFYKSTVLGEITNNDWEGEIKGQGDKVHIRTIPTITVRDYTKGMNLTNEVPVSTPLELTIDYGKYFSVVVDDIDAHQADVKLMDMFTNDASQQMKITIDGMVLDGIKAAAATANKGATAGAISGNLNLGTDASPVAFSKSSALDTILNMGLALDEQNVPEEGRWIVLPAWAGALIKGSELRQAYLTGDSVSPLRNGKIGVIDRFTVYVSNLTPRAAAGYNWAGTTSAGTAKRHAIIAGHKSAITFASQPTPLPPKLNPDPMNEK